MTVNANGALYGGNLALTKAGITGLSGAATTFSTGAAISYTIGGKFIAPKAQITGAAVPTIDVATGAAFKPILAGQAAIFVFTLDAFGNVGVAQGPVPVSPTTTGTQKTVDDNGNFNFLPQFPDVPDTLTPFAYAVVRAQSTIVGNFQFGATPWNATGVVVAGADDVMTLPATPQVS